MRSQLTVLGILGLSSICFANGGPVAWTGGTGGGGVAPQVQNDIALIREDLRIDLEEDLNHYRVRADYLLSNAGAGQKITYGVPIVWVNEEGIEGSGAKKVTAEGKKAAKSIQIEVGGKRHGCTFKEAKADSMIGWCLAELTIPTGDNIALTLSYRGELLYTDAEFSKSALTRFEPRKLIYPLFPAGYWNGPVTRVAITIVPGPYQAGAVPAGFTKENGNWVRVLSNVDLKTAKPVEIEFDSKLLLARQLLQWNKKAQKYQTIKHAVTSSSALPSYGGNNLRDGRGDTAWCVNTAAGGVGEWVQLKEQSVKKREEYCRLEGLSIAPGYLKSNESYRNNGRVKRIRISSCNNPAVAKEFELLLPGHFAEAAQLVEFEDDLAKEAACLKVEIRAVEAGQSSKDTCLSELAAVVNCG